MNVSLMPPPGLRRIKVGALASQLANVVVVLCWKNCMSVRRQFIIVEECKACCFSFVHVCVGGFF